MKNIFKIIPIVALLMSLIPEINAQEQTVLDGAYVKEHNPTKKVIPYPHLREADVMWAKRVWQIIDLREKINQPLYYPIERIEDRKSLFDVLKDAIMVEGSITAYGLGPTDDDDEFRYEMSPAEVDALINPIDTIEFEDLDGNMQTKIEPNPISSELVTQFKIKEDWIFDKQRSERYVRIIGICPMKEDYDDQGFKRGYAPLFWVYFPECRYEFANNSVYNLQNNSQRRTFEEVFTKRMFSSYIVKEENVYDRSISAYAKGVDAQVESDRIKHELFLVEHDLWHY